jgi:putative transposase
LHHSDQGSAYVGTLYEAQIAQLGAIASMSRKGNAYDNAVVESFFSNLKNELICPAPELPRLELFRS